MIPSTCHSFPINAVPVHREPGEQSWEQTEAPILNNLKQQFGLLSQFCTIKKIRGAMLYLYEGLNSYAIQAKQEPMLFLSLVIIREL